MTGTTDAARDVDRVLDGLKGHDLFRRNAFRVTGLPTDVTPRRLRRAREESRNTYYKAPPTVAGAPLPPSEDPGELRAAFEVLQDPVARLVHELLWVPAEDEPESADLRSSAVSAVCRALEATDSSGAVLTEKAWANWRKGLDQWASELGSEAMWKRARLRAEELDDPRATVALVRTMRQRLPAHVVGVVVGLAARRATADPGAAGRILHAVRAAGFDAGEVYRVRRAAAEAHLDRVDAACVVARRTSSEKAGIAAARALLADTRQSLSTLSALLGVDDDLLAGSRDDVALAVNNCVVRHVNASERNFSVGLGLLQEARGLAATAATIDQVETNLATLRVNVVRSGQDPRAGYRPRAGQGYRPAVGRPGAPPWLVELSLAALSILAPAALAGGFFGFIGFVLGVPFLPVFLAVAGFVAVVLVVAYFRNEL